MPLRSSSLPLSLIGTTSAEERSRIVVSLKLSVILQAYAPMVRILIETVSAASGGGAFTTRKTVYVDTKVSGVMMMATNVVSLLS